LPTFSLSGGASALIVDIAVALGMAGSKGEARRLIAQGGVRLDDQVVSDAHAAIADADLGQGGTARLSVGKKRHALIRRS
jgi:tyrosyl-tRNA synthetase